MKTPGRYIVDKNALPSSVVEVPTAVPAFVGWTERAADGNDSLHLTPQRITSMAEFQRCFGGGPVARHARFGLHRLSGDALPADDVAAPLAGRDVEPLHLGGARYRLTQRAGHHLLVHALRLYFMNGGGECIVVSVGGYASAVERAPLEAGLQALAAETGPTLLVIPDAVLLTRDDCQQLQRQMLQHCGQLTRDRFAILDVWEGYRPRTPSAEQVPRQPGGSMEDDVVTAFRAGLGREHLDYGAAYYPWLHTTAVPVAEVGLANLAQDADWDTLIHALRGEAARIGHGHADLPAIEALVARLRATHDEGESRRLTQSLAAVSPFVGELLAAMARRLNLLPPSSAVAGVYAAVDRSRGVWKAPANVAVGGVVGPAVNVSPAQQEDLNVSMDGKSVNAIRAFVGEGALVWGARTLDGNSLDWRYVNVRRTLIMLEQSIGGAMRSRVFEPNAAPTWGTLKAMVTNFLTGVWKRGGLAGATPDDAFNVLVGLGETMTQDDLNDRVLRLTVLVAVVRPAEYIEVTLQQTMQGD